MHNILEILAKPSITVYDTHMHGVFNEKAVQMDKKRSCYSEAAMCEAAIYETAKI